VRSRAMGRRALIRGAAILGGGLVAAPFVRGAHAAGPLSVAFWDHRVPGANDVLRRIVEDWAAENRIELRLDFITSVGDKNALTARAEARARVGHDVFQHAAWQVAVHHRQLEPLDDVVRAVEATHGPFDEPAAFLARIEGRWKGLPAPTGTQSYPMVSRLDRVRQHLDIDLRQLFPAAGTPRRADAIESWSWETFLVHAGRLAEAGRPFAAPVGIGRDAQNWLAPLFLSFGAVLVNARGEIAVDSDQTRNALEYLVRLGERMPADLAGWDEDENNRRLIGDRAGIVINPPGAWAAAGLGQPGLAAQLWHHDLPRGPNGRYRALLPHFLGVWEFARNKPAALDLLRHLGERDVARRLVAASHGFDLPLLKSFRDFDTWERAGPPGGTVYNYPVRGDETAIVAGYPAPPATAALIYNQGLIGRMAERAMRTREPVEKTIAWAGQELEASLRG
jgi:hypothetical protein